MACTALVGINWGDEGKGRMVDLLAEAFDIVVRFQGGANAGHKIINKFGKFDLHLLPSGVCRPGVVNILGNGVALDPETLVKEIEDQKGIEITPENLMKPEEMQQLVADLFSCQVPDLSPSGKRTMVIINENELNEKFRV